jgi:hypothetical protein
MTAAACVALGLVAVVGLLAVAYHKGQLAGLQAGAEDVAFWKRFGETAEKLRALERHARDKEVDAAFVASLAPGWPATLRREPRTPTRCR